MSNMFCNVLGGSTGNSITLIHNDDYNLFDNIKSGFYWPGTIVEADTDKAWFYNMAYGSQSLTFSSQYQFAWAVHDGDVCAVPVPTAVWLFGSGLIGLVGFARKKT